MDTHLSQQNIGTEHHISLRSIRQYLLVAFALSGATALVYEIVWARMLGLVFGNTVYAISTVLAVFFAGLALGSLIFGRVVDRTREPLFLYALLEIGIGAYAMLTPWLFGLIEQVQVGIAGAGNAALFNWSLVQLLLSFTALIIPATLIGGTLPTIIKYFASQPLNASQGRGAKVIERIGTVTAKLYSVNTIGAVVGAILAGFFFILWFGVAGTLYVAAAINILIGLGVLYILRQSPPHEIAVPIPETQEIHSGTFDSRLAIVLASFFLSGFAAIALEVLWTRALILTIGISTYAFSIILMTFLLGIALGSSIVSRFVDRIHAWNSFAVLEVLRGASVIALIPVFGILPFWYLSIIQKLGWSFGAGISTSFLITILVLIIPTLFMGMTFPVVAKIVTKDLDRVGFSVGTAYFFNTLGGVVGSLAAGFILIPEFGVQNSILIAASVYLFVGIVLTLSSTTFSLRAKFGLCLVTVVVFGSAFLIPDWNRFVLQSGIFAQAQGYLGKSGDDLKGDLITREQLFYKEGLSATVAVIQENTQKTLVINGKVQSGTKTDMEPQLLLGHLPMLFHRDPKSALVIGFGSGMTLGAVEQYEELEKVTVVELEPEVIEAAGQFADENNDATNDPRLTTAIGDGRNYLLTISEKFDVISSEPSNPWIKGMATLYTKDFFELAKSHLNDGGLMAQWIQIDSLSTEDLRSFIATFQSVFPYVSVWEAGSSVILVGSTEEENPYFDIERIQQRSAEDVVHHDLARIDVANATAVFGYFVVAGDAVGGLTEGYSLVTDNRPFIEFSSPKSFYQNKDNLVSNSTYLNEVRMPANTFVGETDPGVLEDLEKRFNFRTYYVSAEAAFARGDFEEAASLYKKALEIYPNSTLPVRSLQISYALLASKYEAEGVYEKAEEYYKKLTEEYPSVSLAWRDLGAFYANQSKFEGAEDAFLKALELNPRDAETHVYMGALYRVTNRVGQALTEFERAIELDSNNFGAWNNLGFTYEYLSNREKAKEAYQKALEINPNEEAIQEKLKQL